MKKKSILIQLGAVLALLLLAGTSLANTLYYPHAAVGSSWNTEICAVNTRGTSVSVAFRACDANGTVLQTITRNLNGNGRVELDVATAFTNPAAVAYVIAEASNGIVVGYTKFYVAGNYRGAVAAKSTANDATIYVTHVASTTQWWTGIGILNTTDTALSPRIRFNDGTFVDIALPARAKQAFTVESLLGAKAPLLESAVIENATGIIAFELFGTTPESGQSYLAGIALDQSTVSTLFFPHITTMANSGGAWWSGVVAYNPNASQAALQIFCYDTAGTLLTTISDTVAAGGKYVGTAETLGLPNTTDWVKITTDQKLSGFELFGTTDNSRLAGYECNNLMRSAGILPKIEDDGWTGVAFVNPGDTAVNLTLTAYNDAGTDVATATYTLNPGAKIVRLASELFPGSDWEATYIRFEATGDVLTFQLNGSGDDMMLDALPSLPVSEVREEVDRIMSLYTEASDTLTPLVEELVALLGEVLSGDEDVPITVTPDLSTIDLNDPSTLPSTITVVLDYGTGYTAQDGSTMTGKVTIEITNLVVTETAVSMSIRIVAEDLKRDGTLVLDGEMTLSVSISVSGDVLGLTLSLTMVNMQTISGAFNGSIQISAPSVNVDSGSFSPITVSFTNFTTGEGSIYSGSVVLSEAPGDSYNLDIDVVTSEGAADLTVLITMNANDTISINTTGTGQIGDYQVTLNNVVIDPEVCDGFPTSGTIALVTSGITTTITFTGSCGDFTIN